MQILVCLKHGFAQVAEETLAREKSEAATKIAELENRLKEAEKTRAEYQVKASLFSVCACQLIFISVESQRVEICGTECTWLPSMIISFILTLHTGRGQQ